MTSYRKNFAFHLHIDEYDVDTFVEFDLVFSFFYTLIVCLTELKLRYLLFLVNVWLK